MVHQATNGVRVAGCIKAHSPLDRLHVYDHASFVVCGILVLPAGVFPARVRLLSLVFQEVISFVHSPRQEDPPALPRQIADGQLWAWLLSQEPVYHTLLSCAVAKVMKFMH